MHLGRLIRFLAPDRRKLAILGVFGLIAYAGSIQAWAFCKDCGVPKPPLYDALRFFPVWPVWMMTFVPLFAVASLFAPLAGLPMDPPPVDRLPPAAWIGLVVVYYYLLSCLIAWGFASMAKHKPPLPWWMLIVMPVALLTAFVGIRFAIALLILWPLSLVLPPLLLNVLFWVLQIMAMGWVMFFCAKREQWGAVAIIPIAFLISLGIGPMA